MSLWFETLDHGLRYGHAQSSDENVFPAFTAANAEVMRQVRGALFLQRLLERIKERIVDNVSRPEDIDVMNIEHVDGHGECIAKMAARRAQNR